MGIVRRIAELKPFFKAHIRSIAVLGLLLLFLYAVVPQVAGLSDLAVVIREADMAAVAVAFVCWVAIYLLAVNIYMILALHPIPYSRTLEAQVASGFTGKLLPSGLGVVGLFVQYLRRHGHTTAEAVAVASLNNIVAVIGHLGLLAFFFAIGTPLPAVDAGRLIPSAMTLLYIVAFVVLVVVVAVGLRHRLQAAWAGFAKVLRAYRARPAKIVVSVIVSVPQTLAYIGVLYTSMVALGVDLGFGAVFMVATFSMLVGTIVPVPGGIVGAEAGLTAGFVAYGIPFHQALAIALLYRAFIYWLPIIPGLVLFALRRRDYV